MFKSGGTGLNLTSADVVIHLDLWWNPQAENQATDKLIENDEIDYEGFSKLDEKDIRNLLSLENSEE